MPDVPDADAAALLDNAEDIINAVGPQVISDVEAEEAKAERRKGRWWKNRRR
jgi:hypothetical protein